MDLPMKVTYYYHSGFSVEIGRILMVFDYWRGENGELPPERQLTGEKLKEYDTVVVFISHEHPDHLDDIVYTWRDYTDVKYIISGDMPEGKRGMRLNPGEGLFVARDIAVKAYASTDLGVSYLIRYAGYTLFHAGDLNFWHWQAESTVREIEEAEEDFHAAVQPLMGEDIDLAFFPVDPRQGAMYDAGANYFIMGVKPRLMIPMHFWGRGDMAQEFARRCRTQDTEIVAMTVPGDQLEIERIDGVLTATVISADPVMKGTGAIPVTVPVREPGAPEGPIDLEGGSGDDPFADTDMPVNLNN